MSPQRIAAQTSNLAHNGPDMTNDRLTTASSQHTPDATHPALSNLTAVNESVPNTSRPEEESIFIPAPLLASSRYNRQLLLPQISLSGQNRLLSSRILIIGLGGLGSPAALYLAGAGIGTLGFVDGDTVETSNLHRQIVHREQSAREGLSKVHSAIRGCRELNSEIEYTAHEERLGVSNALGVIERYDLVLDCTDNPATRYLISDACVVLGKTLVSGAAQRLEGQVVVLYYPTTVTDKEGKKSETRGPCYRCIFPRPPDPEMVRGCSEIGILGPAVGCIGTLMASEAIRLIVQGAHLREVEVREERKPSMLLYNAWPTDPKSMFRTIRLAGRRKGCVSCGDEDVLRQHGKEKMTREVFERSSVDYEAWCGRVEDVKVLDKEQRVRADDFLRLNESQRANVVDVREEDEFALGAKIRGAVNVPFSRILRNAEDAFRTLEEEEAEEGNSETQNASGSFYFVCQRGNDSQIAAQKLMDLDERVGRRRSWVGDVEGGFAAMEKLNESRL